MPPPGNSLMSVVDLSHPLRPGGPLWPGDPPTERRAWTSLGPDGYALGVVTVGEHTGTHLGAPAHYEAGGATIDQLPHGNLVRPAAVIDVRDRATHDADYRLPREAAAAWETCHEKIPAGGIVLLLTGWSARWPDPVAYFNAGPDGRMHFPGFSEDTAEWLIVERGVDGLGIDTPGVDGGDDPDFRVGRLLARCGAYHLENLTNLEVLPALGCVVVIGALPIIGGTGSPARVLALVPQG